MDDALALERVTPPGPLRQQVYERLEELIVYGALPPGQHLVESRLAAQLGVSRIPVREALQLLARNGWVDLRPRYGAFVHEPTLKEVEDVFRARALVEVEAARLLAKNATQDHVEELRRMLTDGATAVETCDERLLLRLNEAFHARVTEFAGNRVLAEISALLSKRNSWYFAAVVTERSLESWMEHRELVDAVAAGDPDRAAAVMQQHVDQTGSMYRLHREQLESEPTVGLAEP
ncbi:MAG: FCD domain-containing protein [Nitriliruptorales bacterium]|nr:FCD domain-containing protein [Nitriliruptorales bacterium]